MVAPTNPPTPLTIENATAFVDVENLIVFCSYRNVLSTTETTAVYDWLKAGMMDWFSEEKFRGGIFDFRDVTNFGIGNMPVAKQASKEVNDLVDLSIFPVALLVKNINQEVKVRMSMLDERTSRKRVVHSEEEALAFINSWNETHKRQFEISDDRLAQWPIMPQMVSES